MTVICSVWGSHNSSSAKEIVIPRTMASQLNGSKTRSTGSQKSTTPAYAMQQPLSQIQGILSMHLQIAMKNTSMQDDRNIKHRPWIRHWWKFGNHLQKLLRHEVFCSCVESSDYLGLLTYCWRSGYPFMTKTPFNLTPITQKKKKTLVKLI